jgi:hypothetical protein
VELVHAWNLQKLKMVNTDNNALGLFKAKEATLHSDFWFLELFLPLAEDM